MAKRAAAARTKAKQDNAGGAPSDHNEAAAADDDRRLLAVTHRDRLDAAKRAVVSAREVVQELKAKIRSDKFSVHQIEDMILLLTPEGEKKVRERAQNSIDALRWSGASVGTQFDLLDPSEDRRPAVDRAFDEGKLAGMEGKVRKPPYDPSVPQHQQWINGWNVGQEAKARAGFKAPAAGAAATLEPEPDQEEDVRPPHLRRRDQERAAEEQMRSGPPSDEL